MLALPRESRTVLSALLLVGAVFTACGEDAAAPDTGPDQETDLRGTDVFDDADASDLDDAGDLVGDVAMDPDLSDGGDSDLPTDTVEEVSVPDVRLGEVDSGTACDEDPSVCEDPYACVEGVCTLDVLGQSYVEQTYQVAEPEELAHVFDFVKSFASDVAFLALEFGADGEPSRRPVRYGTADRVRLPDSIETVYRWQSPVQDRLIFTPVRGESGLGGDAWESNVFQWNLDAHVVLEDLRVDTTFGFIAEQTQVYLEFSSDLLVGTGEFRGITTREEAENRIFGDTEFEPFRSLVCRVTPDLLPLGEDWSLADVLDCNAAPLDVDLNGDGILDAYRTVIEMRVEPARLLEAEED